MKSIVYGVEPGQEIDNVEKIEKIKKALGYKTKGRKIISADDTSELREAAAAFVSADNLDSGNTYLWNQ